MDAKPSALLAGALLFAAGLATPYESARAQGNTVVVVGVSDAATGQALQGAEVIFPELFRTGRTDGLGEARISGIPIGSHRIRVRFIGYSAADTVLPFQGDTTGIVFRLERNATKIEGVEVKATGPSRLREFESRRLIGVGKYLTADELERDKDRSFGVVAMSAVPGIERRA